MPCFASQGSGRMHGCEPKQGAESNYISLDNPKFAFIPSNVEASGKLPPIIDLSSLVGRTFLFPETKDGSHDHATITGWVNPPPGNDLLEHAEVMKLHCKVKQGDNSWEDLVAYNKVLRLLEDNLEHKGIWTFKEIIGHQGPLHLKHKNYKGSLWNLQVKWSNGQVAWEPLYNLIKDDPVFTAIYTQKNGRLDNDGWKSLKPYIKNQKKMLQMLHQAKLKSSYQCAPIYKYGYQVPHNHTEAMKLDAENGKYQVV